MGYIKEVMWPDLKDLPHFLTVFIIFIWPLFLVGACVPYALHLIFGEALDIFLKGWETIFIALWFILVFFIEVQWVHYLDWREYNKTRKKES